MAHVNENSVFAVPLYALEGQINPGYSTITTSESSDFSLEQTALCLLCAELPCAADPAPPEEKVKRCMERLWGAVLRLKQAVGSLRTDWCA